MAFIDAMRNDPQDTDPQDQIEELKAKLQEAYARFERLKKYANHKNDCEKHFMKACNCGLAEVLK